MCSTITKTVDFKMPNFGAKTIDNQHNIALSIYNILKNKHDKGKYSSRLISKIKDTLDRLRFNDIWINQDPVNINWFKHIIKQQKISNVYKQEWKEEIEIATGWCRMYKQFKTKHCFDKYLVELEPKHIIPL